MDDWVEAPGRFDGELTPHYVRTGLTTPFHRIDLPLKPATYIVCGQYDLASYSKDSRE